MSVFVNCVIWEALKMIIDDNSITCSVINFSEMSNNDKFQYINKNHQKGLAKFLQNSWERRKGILFTNAI